MRSAVLGAALTALALTLTGHAGGDTGAPPEPDPSSVAPSPSPTPTLTPLPLRTDGAAVTVPAGREVVVAWGDHDVDAVSMTPDRAVRLWDFLVGRDRGLVLAWSDGTEFGYLYPVAGTLPSGDIRDVEPVRDLDELGAQLTDHDRFADLYVRPIGATAVEGFRETLVLDVTTRAAATRDPRPVLRVAPIDDRESGEAVGVGPARGMTERSWIVDVDGALWALTVNGDSDEAIDAGQELLHTLRFDTPVAGPFAAQPSETPQP